MSAKKTSKKKKKTVANTDISERLEHVFLAGLGALTTASELGAKTFESLVDQGQAYSKKASAKTGELIEEVQDAVREVTEGTQDRASGLFDQVRESAGVSRLHDVFDGRVDGALKRLGVPTQKDIDVLHAKLDTLIKLVEGKTAKPARKKPAAKKATAKKATVKKAAAKKATAKKPAAKKATAKKVAAKPVAKTAAVAPEAMATRAAVKKVAARKAAPKKTAAKPGLPISVEPKKDAVGIAETRGETAERAASN